MKPTILAACLLMTAALGPGCFGLFLQDPPPTFSDPLEAYGFEAPAPRDGPVPADQLQWPDFTGAELRILDHGAFVAFGTAADRFEELTGARVVQTSASDTGTALNQAVADRGLPQHDILYGIDDSLLYRAHVHEQIFEPYTPQMAWRVAEGLRFFGDADPWPATPVDHGHIAINVDTGHPDLAGIPVVSLHNLTQNPGLFVTQHPQTSSPGLGFMLITIGRFGETGYTWLDYWEELFLGPDGTPRSGDEVKVTSGWSEAYETYFSGGYGVFTQGHVGDRPIVTSYTTSPAYEWYWDEVHPRETGGDPGANYGSDSGNLPRVLLDPAGSVRHQIQTMGILAGTPNLAVAQAWIEFTLTEDFQELAALENAIYPVAASVDVTPVYQGLDPDPQDLPVVALDWQAIGENLERWIREWTDLCEANECA